MLLVVPPAGLEPAALCLASSIRLSLTARQSWGCWLDYILDVSVPTRIVSEDPFAIDPQRFPADYPILLAFYSNSKKRSKYQRLSGRPRIQGRPLNGFQTFPHQGSNKADALSAELQGHQFNGSGMLPPATDLVNRAFFALNCKEHR